MQQSQPSQNHPIHSKHPIWRNRRFAATLNLWLTFIEATTIYHINLLKKNTHTFSRQKMVLSWLISVVPIIIVGKCPSFDSWREQAVANATRWVIKLRIYFVELSTAKTTNWLEFQKAQLKIHRMAKTRHFQPKAKKKNGARVSVVESRIKDCFSLLIFLHRTEDTPKKLKRLVFYFLKKLIWDILLFIKKSTIKISSSVKV